MNQRDDQKFIFAFIATAVTWLTFIYLSTQWVASDSAQGVIQRIFYYHVPTAWVSFMGFTLTLVYSIRYLKSRDLAIDRKAYVAALLGWLFNTGVIITGPLWAKPVWGHYWNWADQRLVSFFILWLSYTAYLVLRVGIQEPHKRARISSILGILAFIDLPLVYLSIRIWNTPSHPAAVIAGKKGSGLMDPGMKIVFWLGFLCFNILFYLLFLLTKRNEHLKSQIEEISEVKARA